MIKTFGSQDNENLLAEVGQTVSVITTNASIKQASSSKITRELLDAHKPDKDHFLMHVIAMGDDEHYSKNRNNDGWEGKWLSKKACTFVNHGHFYREHENRRKDQRIGAIKAAHYDPQMGRVELIVHGALKPREGEPLTAAPEYERAKAGKNVDVSMSAKVPGDVCTCCKHFAKTASDYCDCIKSYGGRWHPDYEKVAYVLNPDPDFFDISSVKNRADRIARFLEYRFHDGSGYTSKAASVTQGMSGLDMSEMYGITEPSMSASLTHNIERLKKARHELKLNAFLEKTASELLSGSLTAREAEVFASARPPALLRKMAKAGVVLPFESFARVFGTASEESSVLKRAEALCPHCMDLAEQGCTPELENAFDMAPKETENIGADEVDGLMDGVAERLGMKDQDVVPRVSKQTTVIIMPKSASVVLTPGDEAKAKAWAAAYGIYKSSALRDIESFAPDAQYLVYALSV